MIDFAGLILFSHGHDRQPDPRRVRGRRGPARRRTFAIISHPDAGKTTLTENLLLSGGAIQLAGAVRAKARPPHPSDWMKIERERGISVSPRVMTFDYDGLMFNLLDTPGHEDFSEDTYRTLTAVDGAVMVLDAAKGIEPQTLKLFEVCRLRDIPIVTFINKMDREARDPFELLDEIETKLALDPAPLYWPVGAGGVSTACYDLRAPAASAASRRRRRARRARPPSPAPRRHGGSSDSMPTSAAETVARRSSWSRGGCKPFDPRRSCEGHMTPVFFGSALRHFGVDSARRPRRLRAAARRVAAPKTRDRSSAGRPEVSGFVFKIQANMDPNHRDRIAFLRVCSGRFSARHEAEGATPASSSAQRAAVFFARDREIAEEAFAGDVIGIPNHGTLRVGDSLSEGGTSLRRPAELRAGNPAARAGQGPAEGQAPEEGA